MTDISPSAVEAMAKRLNNFREMINYGSGDVRDEPYPEVDEAVALLRSLRAALTEAERQRDESDAKVKRLREALAEIAIKVAHASVPLNIVATEQELQRCDASAVKSIVEFMKGFSAGIVDHFASAALARHAAKSAKGEGDV